MDWSSRCSTDKDAFVRTFLGNLTEEIRRADEFLDPVQAKNFRGYYKAYGKALSSEALQQEITGYIRGDLSYMLNRLLDQEKDRPLRILDAGSGQGTQSILFSLLGDEVVGIDLREDRHSIAIRRHAFYEQELDRPLKVTFSLASIFSFEQPESFDIIWISNAISHIHPLDKLLRLCQQLLKPGGELVIVDLNGLNPVNQFKLFRERGFNLYETVKDPTSGEEVTYAVERILTLPGQCQLLRRYGFNIVHRECFIGYHSRAGERLYETIIKPINRSPLSAVLGRRYVVVGRKEAGAESTTAMATRASGET